ncbi:aminotransferase class V-fold PLP-dependent enzyme [Patescibacteria group bacterium]|nr:aminotransferase class V-fold PLP-dependent enzyme [Patescibacteria group bacterium]
MKKVYFTVGPTQLYPTVKEHIKTAIREDIPSISHRGKRFADIYKQTADNLRRLMGIPSDYHIFFLGSATEAMERIIQNTVKSHSFHLVNGAFSKKFFTIALQLGKMAEKIEVPLGRGFDIKSIKIPEQTECICITQNETSTGVSVPTSDIYYLKHVMQSCHSERSVSGVEESHATKLLSGMRSLHSSADSVGMTGPLVALDVVSSAPYVRIDFSLADMTFFSVQKLFGLPAGLGVLIVSPKAFEKSKNLFEKGAGIGSYHNFLVMEEYSRKYQAHETPNVLGIYLLGKVCNDFLEKGIDTIRKETEEKARVIYEYFDNHAKYKPGVREKKFRSLTTIVIDTQGETAKILPYLAENGFIVSSGYGEFKENQIRIANFPSISLEDAERLLGVFAST